MRLVRRFSPFALALIVCAASLVAPRAADASARSCASSPYAYAGLIGRQKVGGVRATTTAKGTSYTAVVESVSPGASFAVAVVEIAGRANWWRVEVNGKAVSPAIQLPASHGKWQ